MIRSLFTPHKTGGLGMSLDVGQRDENAVSLVEKVIIEGAFQQAVAKLKWLLPFRHPEEGEWRRQEDLSSSLDTTILRDVVLDTFEELNRKHHFIPKHDPRKPSKTTVEKTIGDMVGHVKMREVLQRNIQLGNKLLNLICAGLVEYDLPESTRFHTLKKFINDHAEQVQKEKDAVVFVNEKRTDAQDNLDEIKQAVDEASNQLHANMESYRLHERQVDNEVYETDARVAVELEYTDEFTEHQLQYMAFCRDVEEKALYEKRLTASRKYEFSKLMFKASKDLYQEMADEQQMLHEQRVAIATEEEKKLEGQLDVELKNQEELENDVNRVKNAIEHHLDVINQLRTIRAEEVKEEEELARYLNAVIRIQRWWRYKLWLKSKKKKRKKGKKGKGKGKSKGRKGKK